MIDPSDVNDQRVALSGRKLAGKDHVATEQGYTVYGFADPMYKIAEHFLGSSDKSVPGVRQFLREVGAWGRGQVTQDFPLTPVRAELEQTLRAHGHRVTDMGTVSTWTNFGTDEEFWIDILLDRIWDVDGKIAVTNARFPNEVNRLCNEADFTHYHVTCTPRTRAERHEEVGEEQDEGVPYTERFAAELDAITGSAAPLFDNTVADSYDDLEMADKLDDPHYHRILTGKGVVWNDPQRAKPATTNNQTPTVHA